MIVVDYYIMLINNLKWVLLFYTYSFSVELMNIMCVFLLMFFNRKRNAKMQQELQDAAKDMRGVTTECLSAAVSNSVGPIMASPSAMPRKAAIRFVSI